MPCQEHMAELGFWPIGSQISQFKQTLSSRNQKSQSYVKKKKKKAQIPSVLLSRTSRKTQIVSLSGNILSEFINSLPYSQLGSFV